LHQKRSQQHREDGHDFMRVAAEISIHTEVQIFLLDQANLALNALKNDGIRGAGVLEVQPRTQR